MVFDQVTETAFPIHCYLLPFISLESCFSSLSLSVFFPCRLLFLSLRLPRGISLRGNRSSAKMYSDQNAAESTAPLLEFISDCGSPSLRQPEDSQLARDRALWRTSVSEVSDSFLRRIYFFCQSPCGSWRLFVHFLVNGLHGPGF